METGQDLIDSLDAFIDGVGAEKAAAEAASSQGHVQNQGDSGTSHPSKSDDDGTQEATEGARSAENTSDVKSDTPGQPVDAASEDKMNGASESPLTTAKPTGEDPANETSSADGLIGGDAGKDSEGNDTSHPAKVNFGGKYASDNSFRDMLAKGQVKEAAASLSDRANRYNAGIAALRPDAPPQPAAPRPKSAASNAGSKPAAPTADPDEQAGEKAAALAASRLSVSNQDASELVLETTKRAMADGDDYCDMLAGFQSGEKEAAAASRSEAIRQGARRLHNNVKRAMEDGMAGADMLAQGGEGEVPDTAGDGAGAGNNDPTGEAGPAAEAAGSGDIIPRILAALEAADIDPSVLAEIPPEDIAAAAYGDEAGAGDMLAGDVAGEAMPGSMPAEGGMNAELAPAPV